MVQFWASAYFSFWFLLFEWEESEELGIDHVGDFLEVGGVVAELDVVAVDDEQPAFVLADPLFVALVQAFEVVDADALLEVAAALLYLFYEVGNGRFDVDHQVGQVHERDHQVEQVGIVFKVAVGHHALVVKIGGKDACVFKDGAVLNDGMFAFGNFNHFLESFVKEVDLCVERPAGHVGVEVGQIGIVVNWFKTWCPSVTVGEHFGERGLATANISCYCDMHNSLGVRG